MRTTLLALLLVSAAPALADSGVSGSWTWRYEAGSGGGDLMTALASASAASYNDPGYAILRCLGGRAEFMVGTNGGWGVAGRTLDVTIQADGAPPSTAPWNVSTNGKAVFAPEPVGAFLNALPNSGNLRFAVRDGSGEMREALFALNGLGEVRAKLAQACPLSGDKR